MSTEKNEPWDRPGHSIRFRNDLWDGAAKDTARLAKTERSMDQTLWITQAMEVRLDYLRCWRCRPEAPPVPLEFRDLTGKPFSDWIAAAMRTVLAQHPHHEPVIVGAAAEDAPPRKASRARRPAPPGAVKFMEPEQVTR